MPCEFPLRIRNQYTHDWMFVPCRHCSSCMIDYATLKQCLLSKELHNSYNYLITLEYDNWSVPFILPEMSCVMRYADYVRGRRCAVWSPLDFPVILDYYDDDLSHSKLYKLRNHCCDGAVGVLYYPDLSNFIKRLRKRYGKDSVRFRYFANFEYGPRTHRPHIHCVLSFEQPVDIGDLQHKVIACWPLQSWSRPQIRECIKRCDSHASSYVASYVSGSSGDNGLCSIKRFRPKTQRSKKIDYGSDAQELSQIKDFVLGRNDDHIRKFGYSLFETVDRTKINSITYRPVSSRSFHSVFHKFKGYGNLAFDAYASRARSIYSMYYSGIEAKRSFVESGCLASADLSFMRSFRRYKALMFSNYDVVFDGSKLLSLVPPDNVIFEDYIKVNYMALNYYAAIVLKHDMMQYGDLGHDNYILTRINTDADDIDKKRYRLLCRLGRYVSYDEMCCPDSTLQVIASRRKKYNKYLLPKHFNEYKK